MVVCVIKCTFAKNNCIMTKLYQYISLSLFFVVPAVMQAAEPAFMNAYDPWMIENPAPEVESVNFEEITLKVEGRKVHVFAAEGETLEVYNVAGVKVATYAIDSAEKTISLNVTRGVYILRVGKVARKINII